MIRNLENVLILSHRGENYFSDIVTLISQKLQHLSKLSTIIIFKPCKFNINLRTFCFVLQKVPKIL